jgi:hypothetical protein
MAQPDEYGFFFFYFAESTARQDFMDSCEITDESTHIPCSFSSTLAT